MCLSAQGAAGQPRVQPRAPPPPPPLPCALPPDPAPPPAPLRAPQPRKVCIAVDPSHTSQNALKWAAQTVINPGGELCNTPSTGSSLALHPALATPPSSPPPRLPLLPARADEVRLFTVLHPSPESELKAGVGAGAAGARTAIPGMKVGGGGGGACACACACAGRRACVPRPRSSRAGLPTAAVPRMRPSWQLQLAHSPAALLPLLLPCPQVEADAEELRQSVAFLEECKQKVGPGRWPCCALLRASWRAHGAGRAASAHST